MRKVLSSQNVHLLNSITWSGCIENQEIYELLKDAPVLHTIDIHNMSCSEPENLRKRSKKLVENRSGMQALSLLRLSRLILRSFTTSQRLFEIFGSLSIMGHLKQLKIDDMSIGEHEANHLTEMLAKNQNIQQIEFSRTHWSIWFFSLNLPTFVALKELTIDLRGPSFSRRFGVGDRFCERFPVLSSINITGDLRYDAMYNILNCKNITKVALSLYIYRHVPSVSLSFISLHHARLESVNLFFEFENNLKGECEITGIAAVREQIKAFNLETNCESIT